MLLYRKKFRKKISLVFVWLFLVLCWVSGKSDSVSAIERSTLCSSAMLHLRSSVLIARERAFKDSPQRGVVINYKSIVIVCISRVPYISSDPDRRSSVSLVARVQCDYSQSTVVLFVNGCPVGDHHNLHYRQRLTSGVLAYVRTKRQECMSANPSARSVQKSNFPKCPPS